MNSFRFTVYDPDIKEIMEKLKRKRGIFIEVAVREFLKSEKGKEFLEMLLQEELELERKGKKKEKKISFDEFL
jgi:hypothetical protein